MIIRHFEIKDIKILQKYRYPKLHDIQILALINEWNKGGNSGRYFEMFTIVSGGNVVGELSIQEHTKDSVSVGIHIFEPFRRNGYSANCIKYALKKAKELGYPYVVFLIDKSNELATKIAEKSGFLAISEFINPNGITVVTYKKSTK